MVLVKITYPALVSIARISGRHPRGDMTVSREASRNLIQTDRMADAELVAMWGFGAFYGGRVETALKRLASAQSRNLFGDAGGSVSVALALTCPLVIGSVGL